MGVRVGIVGVSGYGGSELLRLSRGPSGLRGGLRERREHGRPEARPAVPGAGRAPDRATSSSSRSCPRRSTGVDVLFASLPTGKSREPLARVPREVKIVDVGGDHRFVDGWTYGLTELPGTRAAVAQSSRVADPGCYPAAALLALAPLVAERAGGAGRDRDRRQDRRERRGPRRRDERVRVRRDERGRPGLRARRASARPGDAGGADAPRRPPGHAGLHAAPGPDDARDPRDLLRAAARRRDRRRSSRRLPGRCTRDEPFVRVVPVEGGRSPRTKWTTGSNVAFVAYAINRQTGLVLAIGALDNLGKGAAGQAVQNANLDDRAARDGGPRRPPALAVGAARGPLPESAGLPTRALAAGARRAGSPAGQSVGGPPASSTTLTRDADRGHLPGLPRVELRVRRAALPGRAAEHLRRRPARSRGPAGSSASRRWQRW